MSSSTKVRLLTPHLLTQLHSLKHFNRNNTKGEQVKVNLPLEDETEQERPHLPLALLPRRTGVLGTAVRRWRRKPAGGTIFPKSKLGLDAIAALVLPCRSVALICTIGIPWAVQFNSEHSRLRAAFLLLWASLGLYIYQVIMGLKAH
jgi:hypothetical protein